ncbi:hypothetical protein THAOC_00322 [Thalassiosira oceanica]|uniref:Uncharacterized protein n=1 Tax=Thalassiosira oceanica TaxID=159749 RepID=K0TJG7_THAOC|nr:hypothetical protein THAOC_00322 [Thalassiosira oceanica]|eukprot:EJK77815.1 hypothetical protein THAOC_00322 [Thalassiosira oceanica]
MTPAPYLLGPAVRERASAPPAEVQRRRRRRRRPQDPRRRPVAAAIPGRHVEGGGHRPPTFQQRVSKEVGEEVGSQGVFQLPMGMKGKA